MELRVNQKSKESQLTRNRVTKTSRHAQHKLGPSHVDISRNNSSKLKNNNNKNNILKVFVKKWNFFYTN